MRFLDSDFIAGGRVLLTVYSLGSRACTDFTSLIVDDGIGLEGDEAFQVSIEGYSAMAIITILDDDSMYYDNANNAFCSLMTTQHT